MIIIIIISGDIRAIIMSQRIIIRSALELM